MLTFLETIDRLMAVEGLENMGESEEALLMNEELIYLVNFCRENRIELNNENVKGILIGLWSKIGEGNFTHPFVDQLVEEILEAL